ncbi:MAG: type I-U CRISPR-associated protein Csx17 [Methanoregula sp.]
MDRGITEFVRYDLLKRRGDSYIALPSGRFPVTYRRESDLIRQLDQVLQRLDTFLRKEFAQMPAEFVSARRQIDNAIYDALLYGEAFRIKQILAAIGRMERLLAKRDPTRLKNLSRPLSGLSPRWIVAADDGTLELRIAAALASIGATGGVGPIRANLEPVDPKRSYTWKTGEEQVAWTGNNFATRLSGVLMRRLMDARRLNCTSNPLDAVISLAAEDIALFIEGDTDDKLIEDLLFGLLWVKWSDHNETMEMVMKLKECWRVPVTTRIVQRSWALLKLLFLPRAIRIEGQAPVTVKPEPAIIPLLRAGRIDDACDIARKRLFSTGLLPVKATFPNTGNGERIAAALLLPVRGEKKMVQLVIKDGSV